MGFGGVWEIAGSAAHFFCLVLFAPFRFKMHLSGSNLNPFRAPKVHFEAKDVRCVLCVCVGRRSLQNIIVCKQEMLANLLFVVLRFLLTAAWHSDP